MPIDATVAGVNANSYLTLVEADALADEHPSGSVWDAALGQEALLLWATQQLQREDYVGIPYNDTLLEEGYLHSTTQALKWPRVLNDEGDLIRRYPTNAIPMAVKRAQFEVALYREQTGGVAVVAGAVKNLQIGNSVKIEYDSGSSGVVVDSSTDATGFPLEAAKHLRGLRLISVLA